MSKETLHNYRAEIQTVLNIFLHGDDDTIRRFGTRIDSGIETKSYVRYILHPLPPGPSISREDNNGFLSASRVRDDTIVFTCPELTLILTFSAGL
eukprot:COSAG02_NODE_56184_length_286_cov_1.652406_1_plen_94_part_11